MAGGRRHTVVVKQGSDGLFSVAWFQKSNGSFGNEPLVIITHARLSVRQVGLKKNVAVMLYTCETRDWRSPVWDVVTKTTDIKIARRWLYQEYRR